MIIKENAPIFLLLAIPLCLSAVFLLDVIGPFGPTITVLYLPLIAVATRAFTKSGVTYIGLICAVMTCAGFVLGKVDGFDAIPAHYIVATVAAVVATTTLCLLLSRPKGSAT